MERKLGEIFNYNNEYYQVHSGAGCTECVFYSGGRCCRNKAGIGECVSYYRNDHTDVIFKKVEGIQNKREPSNPPILNKKSILLLII